MTSGPFVQQLIANKETITTKMNFKGLLHCRFTNLMKDSRHAGLLP